MRIVRSGVPSSVEAPMPTVRCPPSASPRGPRGRCESSCEARMDASGAPDAAPGAEEPVARWPSTSSTSGRLAAQRERASVLGT